MNGVAAALAHLPNDTRVSITVGAGDITMGQIRAAASQSRPDRLLTTTEASEAFGYSSDTWRKWASAGEIEGASQDAEGGPWRLPYGACEAHHEIRSKKGGVRRGKPRKTTAPASAPQVGSESLSSRGLALV